MAVQWKALKADLRRDKAHIAGPLPGISYTVRSSCKLPGNSHAQSLLETTMGNSDVKVV